MTKPTEKKGTPGASDDKGDFWGSVREEQRRLEHRIERLADPNRHQTPPCLPPPRAHAKQQPCRSGGDHVTTSAFVPATVPAPPQVARKPSTFPWKMAKWNLAIRG